MLIFTATASRKYSFEIQLSAVEINGWKIQLIGVWLVICRIWWGLSMLISAAVATSKYKLRNTIEKYGWIHTHTVEESLIDNLLDMLSEDWVYVNFCCHGSKANQVVESTACGTALNAYWHLQWYDNQCMWINININMDFIAFLRHICKQNQVV